MTRRISSSRPITGSSLPLSASAVRSRPYFSSAPKVSSGLGEVTRCGPRTSEIACTSSLRAGSSSETPDFDSARASRMCSVEMYSSPSPVDSFSACCRTQTNSLEGRTSGTVLPLSLGQLLDRLAGPAAGVLRVDAEPLQDRHDDALVLLEQGEEQVGRGDLGIRVLRGEPLRGGHRLLGLDRESVWLHLGPMVAAFSRESKEIYVG